MKVLALNGSPRMKASSTYHMLKPLIKGMEAADAEVDLLHIRKLDLKACIGCYTCWVRTPGECIHKDSMTEAIKLYNEADLVIFGTPLYHFSMSGIMKTFIDRTLPRIEPWLIPHPDIPDVTFHPERFHKPSKMMLVSPCGFPEFYHFESLVATFKQMARMERMEYVGEILRSGAEALSRRTLQGMFTGYYDLIRQAGTQIIADGSIAPDLQSELGKDLFPGGKQTFYDMAGAYWTQQMDRFNVPDEKRHTVPILPADLDSIPYAPGGETVEVEMVNGRFPVTNKKMLDYMVGMYNPKAVPDLRATIQFTFSMPAGKTFDTGGMDWYMDIGGGQCTLHEGRTAVPTLAITTPYEVWYDIGLGKIDAEEAFTDGKYDANGSMTVMEQFTHLFQYPQPGKNSELEMIMLGMPLALNTKVAAGLDITIQFVLGGAGGGMYHVRINDGVCTAHPAPTLDADLTIYAPASVWLAISKGELDGQAAFMSGAYRAVGDMGLMLKMNDLFTSVGDMAVLLSPEPTKEETEMENEIDMNSLNCHDTIAGMPTVFNAEAAGGMTAVIQFHVTGEETGDYYLAIGDGTCTFNDGIADAPTLTINTPSEIWLAVSRGELDGQMAFMQQKYTVEGDFSVLLKMNTLFRNEP